MIKFIASFLILSNILLSVISYNDCSTNICKTEETKSMEIHCESCLNCSHLTLVTFSPLILKSNFLYRKYIVQNSPIKIQHWVQSIDRPPIA